MVSLIRRRMMVLQSALDEYEGCDFGFFVTKNAHEMPEGMTPIVELPSNCASLEFCHYFNATGVPMVIYYTNASTPSSNANSYGAGATLSKTITAGQYSHVRMCFNIDRIDDCYIKDDTNNTYLWKGKNVT